MQRYESYFILHLCDTNVIFQWNGFSFSQTPLVSAPSGQHFAVGHHLGTDQFVAGAKALARFHADHPRVCILVVTSPPQCLLADHTWQMTLVGRKTFQVVVVSTVGGKINVIFVAHTAKHYPQNAHFYNICCDYVFLQINPKI